MVLLVVAPQPLGRRVARQRRAAAVGGPGIEVDAAILGGLLPAGVVEALTGPAGGGCALAHPPVGRATEARVGPRDVDEGTTGPAGVLGAERDDITGCEVDGNGFGVLPVVVGEDQGAVDIELVGVVDAHRERRRLAVARRWRRRISGGDVDEERVVDRGAGLVGSGDGDGDLTDVAGRGRAGEGGAVEVEPVWQRLTVGEPGRQGQRVAGIRIGEGTAGHGEGESVTRLGVLVGERLGDGRRRIVVRRWRWRLAIARDDVAEVDEALVLLVVAPQPLGRRVARQRRAAAVGGPGIEVDAAILGGLLPAGVVEALTGPAGGGCALAHPPVGRATEARVGPRDVDEGTTGPAGVLGAERDDITGCEVDGNGFGVLPVVVGEDQGAVDIELVGVVDAHRERRRLAVARRWRRRISGGDVDEERVVDRGAGLVGSGDGDGDLTDVAGRGRAGEGGAVEVEPVWQRLTVGEPGRQGQRVAGIRIGEGTAGHGEGESVTRLGVLVGERLGDGRRRIVVRRWRWRWRPAVARDDVAEVDGVVELPVVTPDPLPRRILRQVRRRAVNAPRN